MIVRRVLRASKASIALVVGGILVVTGGGLGLVTLASTTMAGAATAKAGSPLPVVEQNLDSAGRIRVALPTNQIGQVQISHGNAANTAVNGPWAVVGNYQTITMASIQGPGVFTGLTLNTDAWACGCWNPDGTVTVTIDGQVVFNNVLSWIGANWMSGEGGMIGGQWEPGFWSTCGLMFWWPPGGIAFQSNVTVTFDDWNNNPEYVWTNVFENSVLPVTSSPY